MPIQLYNTLTRSKEPFVPAGDVATIYGCGPTVYNYFHIGNARMFVTFDTLRRYLQYRGIPVKYAQNFTDVDDRIIKLAAAEGITAKEFSERYIAEFFTDADGLNILRADVYPKATESIDDMLSLIQVLVDRGQAYANDSGVYFRTRSFAEYGKLSHQSVDDLESGARIDIDEQKEDPLDFALWKLAKPGEPSWPSPWGGGRPGWHIECSAMIKRHLGDTIDIHGGAVDLIFPHHENEIAQSEAANGVPLSRWFTHCAFLNIDGEKMSKSSGRMVTPRELAAEYGYDVLRFALISAHYRSPISFSDEIIEQSRAALSRIRGCRERLAFVCGDTPADGDAFGQYRDRFITAMDDDLNTADGLGVIFDLVRELNTQSNAEGAPDRGLLAGGAALLDELCGVLGLVALPEKSGGDRREQADKLSAERTEAKKRKDFAQADALRAQIEALGFKVEDTPQGARLI